MIEEQPTLCRSCEEDTEKSSPGKSDCTYDTLPEITPFFIPVPVFVFYSAPNIFPQFHLPFGEGEPQAIHSGFRTVETYFSSQDIKIEAAESINFNNKN